jgi:uncharacterized protein (UPF0335 family)
VSRDPATNHAKQLLVSHIRAVKALREQRSDINAEISARKKEAKDQGFDGTKIEEVVRWIEKVEKHGRDVMDEAEALYDLYRTTWDGGGIDLDALMDDARDRALLKMFAPDAQQEVKGPTKKQKAVADALAMAEANRAMRDARPDGRT